VEGGQVAVTAVPAADPAGRLLVCFDFEGAYGTPHKDEPYDQAANARAILDELARQDARAVFFVVGRMVEEQPEVVASLAAAGHEIGLHGYEHDDLGRYDAEAVTLLDKNLARVSSLLEQMTGARPQAFRAPYLLGPDSYRGDVYSVLREQGFRWVSNREVRYPVELLRPRPGVVPSYAWRGSGGAARLARNRLLLGPLNAKLLAKGGFLGSPADRLRWLLGRREPFTRDGMTEVPVYAPLDCDLLGLPRHGEDTPAAALEYARAVIRAAVAPRPGELSMITFHDWIVSGGNRLSLLADALTAARDHGAQIATIAESPGWLSSTG
jgi:peptidoglycan/xylan/chitin deacetylase (PgdA/CDA1 family)